MEIKTLIYQAAFFLLIAYADYVRLQFVKRKQLHEFQLKYIIESKAEV
jgi:hypothetical protein